MGQKCEGHNKQTGEPCGRWARRGATVCDSHGGKARQVREKAAERVATDKAHDAIRKLSWRPVDNPLTALSEVAGEIVALKDHLRGEVERLSRLRYEDNKGSEQIRGELQAYQAALRDTVSVLAVIGKLNIEERLTRVTEAQAAMVMAAIDAALDAAGVARELRPGAKRAAAGRLRVVA